MSMQYSLPNELTLEASDKKLYKLLVEYRAKLGALYDAPEWQSAQIKGVINDINSLTKIIAELESNKCGKAAVQQ